MSFVEFGDTLRGYQESPSLNHPVSFSLDRVQSLLYDVIFQVGKQVASGFAVAYVYPSMILPCCLFSSVVILTHLATKSDGCYNSALLARSRAAVWDLNSRYPNLQMITFLFALALSLISPKLAGVVAVMAGVHSGITVGIEASLRKQRAENDNSL